MMAGEHHDAGADALPESVSTGKGMSVRAMLQAARDWARRQVGEQRGFGWTTLKKRQAQIRRAARKQARIEFQSARQHPPETGVRKFRVSGDDPWSRL